MDTDARRRRLDDGQQRLLRALVAGGPVPRGFDPALLQVATRLLGEKRWRQVEHGRPALTRDLGACGPARFSAYASRSPRPDGGAEADALCFVREAVDPAELSDDARLEQAVARSRLRIRRGRVVRRRGPFVTGVTFRGTRRRRTVLVVRLPLLGERVVGR